MRDGVRIWITAIALLGLTCGGGPRTPTLRDPTPADPWFGTAGNVLISDRQVTEDVFIDSTWVGFNFPAEWQNLEKMNAQHPTGNYWVGGRVVADPRHPLGFYFDPDTTFAAEVTAEGIQTTLDQIKADPATFAENPLGAWVVPVRVERLAQASP